MTHWTFEGKIWSLLAVTGLLVSCQSSPVVPPEPSPSAAVTPATTARTRSDFNAQIRSLLPVQPRDTGDSPVDEAFDRATRLQSDHQFEAAIAAWKKILHDFKLEADDREEICFNIAYLYEQQYDLKSDAALLRQALDWYGQAIRINPNQAVTYFNRGNVYSDLNDFPHALADYNEAVKLNPLDADALVNRGQVYGQLHQDEAALKDFTQALKLNSRHETARINRADLLLDLKRYPEAIADYTEALKLNPRNPETLANRADAYYQQGDYPPAIADLTAAIALAPQAAGLYFRRGMIYADRHDLKAALQDYNRCLELKPREHDVLFERAVVSTQLRNYAAAMADYEQCLKLSRSDSVTYLNYLELLLITGRYQDFSSLLARFMRNIPDRQLEPEAIVMREFLDALCLIASGQAADAQVVRVKTLLKQTPHPDWDFTEINDWLKNPGNRLNPGQQQRIRKLTELFPH